MAPEYGSCVRSAGDASRGAGAISISCANSWIRVFRAGKTPNFVGFMRDCKLDIILSIWPILLPEEAATRLSLAELQRRKAE